MATKMELNRRIQLLEEEAKLQKAKFSAAEREIRRLERLVSRERDKNKIDIEYPRDIIEGLIRGNSPYAFYLFQWVPYQTDAKRWRFKLCHDVKTFDGREAHGIWPNGTSCGPFSDDEVEFIRISKKQFDCEWVDPRPESESVEELADE